MKKAKNNLFMSIIVCIIICFVSSIISINTDEEKIRLDATKTNNLEYIQSIKNKASIKEIKEPEYVYNSKKWSENDKYLLAKIAMAEAEGCSIDTKCLVIMTVLNRLENDEFPNTIKEVIYQKHGNVYQFTPIGNGRWDKVEPNKECWEALDIVMTTETDFSKGVLYFESCKNKDNWHSRNLEFVCKYDTMRFYK